jgi:hypothetical protein
MTTDCMCRVWDHSTQKGSALLLLLAIADGAGEYGLAFPCLATLAARIRESRDQTLRLLARLQDAGELLVLQCAGGGFFCIVRTGASPHDLAAALDRAVREGGSLPAGTLERVLDTASPGGETPVTAIQPGPVPPWE